MGLFWVREGCSLDSLLRMLLEEVVLSIFKKDIPAAHDTAGTKAAL